MKNESQNEANIDAKIIKKKIGRPRGRDMSTSTAFGWCFEECDLLMIFEVCNNLPKIIKVRHLGAKTAQESTGRQHEAGHREVRRGLKPLRVWKYRALEIWDLTRQELEAKV